MKARIWNHRSWIAEVGHHELRMQFDALLKQAGFSIVGFSEARFQPHGYTAIWLLAESHFALHTFPEEGRTYCELSSCNREKFVALIELIEPHEIAYLHRHCHGIGPIQLQRRCEGIEIGVGRYFNGRDWVGPVELNVEHKDLCTGHLGPKTWEMGTLMTFADATQPLYRATLAKLQPHLAEIGFRGDIDINCIVNADGVFPLEITARFGLPKGQIINDASLIKEHLYSLETYRSLDDITRNQVDKFVTVAHDGFFCIPNINYMPTSWYCNHSCDPNVGFDRHDNMVLIRDVNAGDELCIDYAFSITNPDWKLECRCGSSKCRKIITGNDWKNPEYFNANKHYMSI